MNVTVTHSCGCVREVTAKGPREARQLQNWLGTVKCPTCEQAYWTVRYYNASGIGVEQEWTNVYAKSEEEAKDYARTNYRIFPGNMYRLYAFLQAARM